MMIRDCGLLFLATLYILAVCLWATSQKGTTVLL